jgi:hypothetical protein
MELLMLSKVKTVGIGLSMESKETTGKLGKSGQTMLDST